MTKRVGILLPVLFILFFLDGQVAYGSKICPVVAPPVTVIVKAEASDMEFNNKRTSNSLASESIDSSILTKMDSKFIVGGLARGDIDMSQEVVFGTQSDLVTGAKCAWVERVTVNIDVKHTIYIARKYKPGTCMFRETYNHEIKHVNVDRQVVNKYAGKIRNQAKMVASTIGTNFVPNSDSLAKIKDELISKIQKSINPIVQEMQRERRMRQDAIDTPEEYARVQNACKARY